LAFILGILSGPREKQGWRIGFGAIGGLIGAIVGMWVARTFVKMPGLANFAPVAFFALIGVILGVVVGRVR
jgi:hypothetical protein